MADLLSRRVTTVFVPCFFRQDEKQSQLKFGIAARCRSYEGNVEFVGAASCRDSLRQPALSLDPVEFL